MKFNIIKPFGYCFGVKKALNDVINLRNNNPISKIFLLGDIVHNENIKNRLTEKNIQTLNLNHLEILSYIKEVDLTQNDFVVLSAHGHYLDLENYLLNQNIKYLDTTCPIIRSINEKLMKTDFSKKNVVYIGKKDHIECIISNKFINNKNTLIIDDLKKINLLDYFKDISYEFIFINQSTISIDFLENYLNKNYNKIKFKIINNFCPEIKNRFLKIKESYKNNDTIIIFGDKKSSNANSLYNYAKHIYKKNYFFINSTSEFEELIKIFNLNKNQYNNIALISSTSMDETILEQIKNIINLYQDR